MKKNVKNYNHNFKIYKKYTIEETKTHIDNNNLPNQDLYSESDKYDSLKRCTVLFDLIKRDGCNGKTK
jgi:hypothetical protein